MTEIAMSKGTRNRGRRIFQNIMTALTILLLIAAVIIAGYILTGCSKEPETFPDAEKQVMTELSEIKAEEGNASNLKAITEIADENEGASLEGYIDKVKDFDCEIVGSRKAEGDDDNTAIVTARIKTYDFGNIYLKAWNEYLALEEYQRDEREFNAGLLLRLASVSSKDFLTDVDIKCQDPDGDGTWTTDIKTNEDLMNALSGGMLKEMENLADEMPEEETEGE